MTFFKYIYCIVEPKILQLKTPKKDKKKKEQTDKNIKIDFDMGEEVTRYEAFNLAKAKKQPDTDIEEDIKHMGLLQMDHLISSDW